MDTIHSETVLVKRSRCLELGPTQMTQILLCTPVFELSHGRRRARLVTNLWKGAMEKRKREAHGWAKGRGRDERKVSVRRPNSGVCAAPFLGGEGRGDTCTRERVVGGRTGCRRGVAVYFVCSLSLWFQPPRQSIHRLRRLGFGGNQEGEWGPTTSCAYLTLEHGNLRRTRC